MAGQHQFQVRRVQRFECVFRSTCHLRCRGMKTPCQPLAWQQGRPREKDQTLLRPYSNSRRRLYQSINETIDGCPHRCLLISLAKPPLCLLSLSPQRCMTFAAPLLTSKFVLMALGFPRVTKGSMAHKPSAAMRESENREY